MLISAIFESYFVYKNSTLIREYKMDIQNVSLQLHLPKHRANTNVAFALLCSSRFPLWSLNENFRLIICDFLFSFIPLSCQGVEKSLTAKVFVEPNFIWCSVLSAGTKHVCEGETSSIDETRYETSNLDETRHNETSSLSDIKSRRHTKTRRDTVQRDISLD